MSRHLTLATLLLLLAIPTARADQAAEQSRAITTKNADAVVTLRFVLNEQFSMPGFGSEDTEFVAETTGTVINADGLIVASLSETNPLGMLESMLGAMGGMGMGIDFDTTVDSVTIIRPNKEDIIGKVVIRDVDLDLAFIRPDTKPESPWPSVELNSASAAQQYDPILVLHRLGRVASRTHAGALLRISAVMSKPRTFYILDAVGGALGAPAFGADGNCIGITVLRTIKTEGSSGGMGGMLGMLGGMTGAADNVAQVILPGADVLESATQAPGYDE